MKPPIVVQPDDPTKLGTAYLRFSEDQYFDELHEALFYLGATVTLHLLRSGASADELFAEAEARRLMLRHQFGADSEDV